MGAGWGIWGLENLEINAIKLTFHKVEKSTTTENAEIKSIRNNYLLRQKFYVRKLNI